MPLPEALLVDGRCAAHSTAPHPHTAHASVLTPKFGYSRLLTYGGGVAGAFRRAAYHALPLYITVPFITAPLVSFGVTCMARAACGGITRFLRVTRFAITIFGGAVAILPRRQSTLAVAWRTHLVCCPCHIVFAVLLRCVGWVSTLRVRYAAARGYAALATLPWRLPHPHYYLRVLPFSTLPVDDDIGDGGDDGRLVVGDSACAGGGGI